MIPLLTLLCLASFPLSPLETLPPDSVPFTSDTVLLRELGSNDPLARERAAAVLGALGSGANAAIPALIGALADPDPYVNGSAADALGRIGEAAIGPLAAALGDARANVRRCAAIALGKAGAAAAPAVPALAQALLDTSADVRWCAAIALGAVGEGAHGAVPALLGLLRDPDDDVRWGAADALRRIDPGVVGTPLSLPAAIARIDSLTPLLMRELRVPGVSIAVIHGRELAWSKQYGFADADRRLPVTGATLFEACSMTKPVFAYTVLQLVDRGELNLDRPLLSYRNERILPEQAERRLITPRMILSHSSGLPNWRKGEEERDGPLPVLFAPGSRFGYSGEGIFWLQRVVEAVTGEPLEEYAQRTLFRPLGLTGMSYVWTPAAGDRLASGHGADGACLGASRYLHANAAYTLYTTAEDYARFLLEILRPDRSAPHSVTERGILEMLAPQTAVHVRDPIVRPGRAMGTAVSWGLGWCINATGAGDIAHHSGANRTGFRCFSQFSMTGGSGIVIMTNSVNGGELWERLVREVGDL